ncbi:hypothetical protein C5E08_05505 [Rathayibacter iranicus]|uniref:PPM-type phosphatase domain-containing protein n=1 Tax=Rathayibacter iranicus TaxID=59737 RepID=A0AAD1ABW2_9MICO|nr:hypothetical protein C7V51_05525 [Rathayibacter iranicus]PPI48191.1 hypothetical protein C5E09_04595 [Rathayibacter iranicus]PPI61407.1 hypothetical protein C5E08_05505 [Rathayibacter iranicus]
MLCCSDGLLDALGGGLDAFDALAPLVRAGDDDALFGYLDELAVDAHDDVTALVLRRSPAASPS